MQLILILDQIQAIQGELDKAHAAKSEANFAIDNSDSVDKSIIQALKNEGEDQKQTVENIQLIISKSNMDKGLNFQSDKLSIKIGYICRLQIFLKKWLSLLPNF